MSKSKILSFADNLMERSPPGRPVWNIEQLSGHTQPGWNYVDGCMMKAMLDLYGATGDHKYAGFADRFTDYYIGGGGEILGYDREAFNSDSVNGGKVLFALYELTGKEKYRKAAHRLYDQLLSHPRTASGSFWHKKIYPHQVWLDGLYMTLPFYAEYERRLNQSRNLGDIVKQFGNVRNNMRDETTGLLYHGRDESLQAVWADPQTGRSRHFWGRSLGWCVMALLDTAEQIDEQQFDQRETLVGYLKELVDAMLNFTDPETGMLWQVADQTGQAGNYLETSASCALAYTLMKAARLGFLPEYYFQHGNRIFDSVVRHKLRSDGNAPVLSDICLVAGLGIYLGKGDYKERDGTYEYYISEPRVDNDAKGVAPFLMAFAELLRKNGGQC